AWAAARAAMAEAADRGGRSWTRDELYDRPRPGSPARDDDRGGSADGGGTAADGRSAGRLLPRARGLAAVEAGRVLTEDLQGGRRLGGVLIENPFDGVPDR